MEQIDKFTFFYSYWDAVKDFPKKDRQAILEAIIAFGLEGTEPAGLSPLQMGCFKLVKPTLELSRKRAAAGKTGGAK